MRTSTRFVLAALSLAALSACGQTASQPTPSTDQDRVAIHRAAELWVNGFNAESTDAVASVFADDAWMMKPGQPPIIGRRAIQDDLARSWAIAPFDVSVGETDLEIVGDVAWRAGRFEGRDAQGTVVQRGTFIEIWRRIDGTWQIYRDIWNTEATATPAG